MLTLIDGFNIREKIIKACLLLLDKGLVKGTGGNVSVRTKEGFLITPSGIDYGVLSISDIVELNMDGDVVKGERVPSVEKELHRMIFAARKDVNAIVHTHPIYTTSVAATRKDMYPLTDNQVVLFGGSIKTANYAPIGSKELAETVLEALGDGGAALMSNHGAVCVGETLQEAMFRSEMLEDFAKIFILAKKAGGGVPLTDTEIYEIKTEVKEKYGQKEYNK